MIQAKESAYDVCDTFRRSQTRNGVRVGNDFGQKRSPANSVTILNPDPQHGMGSKSPNRSVEIHRVSFFSLSRTSDEKKEDKTCEIYRS